MKKSLLILTDLDNWYPSIGHNYTNKSLIA